MGLHSSSIGLGFSNDASNNINRHLVSAQNAHGLVTSHFGQRAAETLEKIASGIDRHLSQKLKINSNPEYSIRRFK